MLCNQRVMVPWCNVRLEEARPAIPAKCERPRTKKTCKSSNDMMCDCETSKP